MRPLVLTLRFATLIFNPHVNLSEAKDGDEGVTRENTLNSQTFNRCRGFSMNEQGASENSALILQRFKSSNLQFFFKTSKFLKSFRHAMGME